MATVEELRKEEELKIITPTDNTVKAGDGVQPDQNPVSLFMEGEGIPHGIKVGEV